MPSLANANDRKALEARIEKLTPDTRPAWGTLTAQRMLCHLTDQMRVGLGEIESRDRSNLLTRTIVKWLVLRFGIPRPKGKKLETAREMLSTEPTDWQADKASLMATMERLASTETAAPHPLFGAMSHRQWCILGAVHIEYHLRQFGV